MTNSEILARAAIACLNDYGRTEYTDEVLLPHLNTARTELAELFELYNIPVTNETSGTITVPEGTTKIGFNTLPSLPAGLVEIQRMYESVVDQAIWVPMTKREFLTDSVVMPETQLTTFGVWAWMGQSVRVPSAINDVDIKFDYIRNIFYELKESNLGEENSIINTDNFLFFRTAALAAEFIGEDVERGASLNGQAGGALSRSLGISIKGKQSIQVRRRPFRERFKSRRLIN